MPWTYGGDPQAGGTAAQQRDAVRFLAQVNDSAAKPGSAILDAEIAFVLAEEPNVYCAAARIAEVAAGRTGGVQSKSIGGLAITYGAQHYQDLAAALRRRGSAYQLPSAGGLSVSEKDAVAADQDLVRPGFMRGEFDEVAG